jgi:hypothetical protein
MTILAEIDGLTVPLTDCCWIQTRPCGCMTAALTAAHGDDAYATAEQAHKELQPTKRERDRDIKQGKTLKLMTFPQYRALNGGRWECAEHYKPRPAVDQVPGQLAIPV